MADFITDKVFDKHLIRVFTLNCWGIPYISKDRKSRICAIADFLMSSNLDMVCLQEIWSKKDYLYLSKKCDSQFPYSHYFNSFINGSGLCVFSKYPITDVYFHQWPINGYAHKIHQGDWFAGKGLAFTRIKVQDVVIHLYNAHLHAEYNIHNTDYLSHRVLQAFDTSQFIKLTNEDCDLAILAGDLNTEPDDLAMKILIQNAHLLDSFNTAQEKSSALLGTNASTRNSYSPQSELKQEPEGKRIDYILYKNSKRLNVDVVQYRYPLPERVPGCSHSYSDHEGIEVTFHCELHPTHDGKMARIVINFTDFIKSLSNAITPAVNPSELEETLETAIGICNDALNKLQVSQKTYLTCSVLFFLLVLISLFAELFFNVSPDMGGTHVASVIGFNIVKVFFTLAFVFFTLMGTLWSKSEKSAVLTGKFSMMTILKRLHKS